MRAKKNALNAHLEGRISPPFRAFLAQGAEAYASIPYAVIVF